MQENIKRTIHSLILQALPPERGEGKDSLGLQIQHINKHLVLACVHLIAIDPHLEGLGHTGLVDLCEKLGDHGHVIVDHHYIGTQLANHIGQDSEAEPLLEGSLERCGINDAHIGWVGAIAALELLLRELLEAEMSHGEPGILC